MSLSAMAPPLSLDGKLLAALIMLGLTGLLIRAIRREPLHGTSIALSVIAVVVMVAILEAALPSSYGGSLQDRGALAAIVGAVGGAVLLRPKLGRPDDRQPLAHTVGRAVLVFLCGPTLGLLLALPLVLFGDASPADRRHDVLVLVCMGTAAGGVVAIVALLADLMSSRRSSR